MRFLAIALLICGCSSTVSQDPAPECELDNECFRSYCSVSRCVDGACEHEQIEDGTTCLDPDWGYGACESSVCVVDP
jgi:hypothetical protein